MIKIQIPATSANIGSGFDSLGIALDLYNYVWMEEDDVINISSKDEIEVPCDESNLIYWSAQRLYDEAKALLAEAGYPDGFSMTITVPSNYQPHIDTAQVIAQQLKDIGVTAELQLVEWGTWLSDVYAGRQFQSTVIGVDASNMTARALLERFTSTASNDFINYENAEYDALFAQAQASYDDAVQTAIYKQMERNLTENAANVYIQDMADLVAVRKGLEGVRFYPIYVLDLSALRYAG